MCNETYSLQIIFYFFPLVFNANDCANYFPILQENFSISLTFSLLSNIISLQQLQVT